MTTVWTARVTYAGPDRLDITRKSAGPEGLPFAPSWRILRPMLACRATGRLEDAWPQYIEAYTAEMRASYQLQRPAWDAVLVRSEVTLVCYCKDAGRCHRTLLAEMLGKLGATVQGER